MLSSGMACNPSVSRRTGGLEILFDASALYRNVSRRTGGLEMNMSGLLLMVPVSRRTGGLEMLSWGTTSSDSSQPPHRRLRKLV